MERKIQSVGNSSFSVSLPKKWVEKSKLGAQSSVYFKELGDGSLLILPGMAPEKKSFDKFSIKVEEHREIFGQLIFAAYYLGAEDITIYSEKNLSDKVRSEIKDIASYMSGTEIVFEGEKKISLQVLLDKTKINANNIISRIGLIIDSSFNNCLNNIDLKEIERNEEEIDRLYNLVSKIILISLSDSEILRSSGIKYQSLSVPYLLISKKLENIADTLEDLARFLKGNKKAKKEASALILVVKEFIRENMHFPYRLSETKFHVPSKEELAELKAKLRGISDTDVRGEVQRLHRLMYDIQEELINLSFYNQMIKENIFE